MRAALLTAIAAGGLAAPAVASDILIEDFVGTITVVDGRPGIDIQRTHDGLTTQDGDTILIDGGFERPERSGICGSSGWSWFGGGNDAADLDEFANIVVSVPEGSTLTIRNSIVALDTSDAALSEADLDLMGCLDISLGDILTAEIKKSGSGDFEAAAIGTLDMGKSGSGNLSLDDVGTIELSKSGSGNVTIGRIGRSADFRQSGSGNLEIGEMTGPLSVSKSGSGDVDVGDGDIPRLDVSKSGSGDVDVAATVGSAGIKSSGSGNVTLARLTGDLEQSSSGSSRVRILDRG